MITAACRACGAEDLERFYEVRGVPVQSALLLSDRDEALAFPVADVELAVCRACGFVQNRRFDPALTRYTVDYEDMQGFSPRWRRFAEALCDAQIARFGLAGKTVLEIGCGKGEFLALLCERAGCRGIGMDPAYRPGRLASSAAARLDFRPELYRPANAAVEADYVCCRHTLEHLQDPRELLGVLRRGLAGRPEVPVFFEVPDMERILAEQAFWDIYYEHCSYFTRGSLARLFRSMDFGVLDVYRGFDAQYLMIEARLAAAATPLPQEDDLERTLALVARFRDGVAARLRAMATEVEAWMKAGRCVVTWGSGSKGVGWVTTLGLRDEISAVVDINPHRWGRFIAGTGHEIVGPDELRRIRPDTVVLMNPIYGEEVRRELRARGLEPELVAL
jgi:SAM-dependent methyltransferase